MSADDSKQVVRRYFDAVAGGNEAEILGLLDENFTFEAMLRRPEWMKYRWTREQFAATPAAMSALMDKPIVMQIVDMIAEGDKVAVQATSDVMMKNGKRYDNAYHFAFVVRNGKIVDAKEYSCSHLAQDCFSDMNPWAGEDFKQEAITAA